MNYDKLRKFRDFYLSLVGLPLINGGIGFTVMLIQSRSLDIALVFVPFMAIPSFISALFIRWANKAEQSEKQA